MMIEYNDEYGYEYLCQLPNMYIISPSTHFIKQSSLYKPKNTNIIITTLSALSEWSHIK